MKDFASSEDLPQSELQTQTVGTSQDGLEFSLCWQPH